MNYRKVSAIVVTFNRLSLLKENIECLLKQDYPLEKIFVFNNNSTDGTEKYLNEINNDKIIPINSTKNIGGAGGFSNCLKIAYNNSDSDYFWIMDDDTMPQNDSLKALMEKNEILSGNFGFLCSNVRWWQNNDPCNIPSVAYDWTSRVDQHLIKVNTATFVSILVSRNNIDKLGLPIKEMFIWGDDTEYTLRLSRYDDSYFVEDSIVKHKTKTNRSYETILNCDKNRIILYKYMYRNLIYMDKIYFSKKRIMKDFLSFGKLSIIALIKSKKLRFKRCLVIVKGIFSGLLFNPEKEYPND